MLSFQVIEHLYLSLKVTKFSFRGVKGTNFRWIMAKSPLSFI